MDKKDRLEYCYVATNTEGELDATLAKMLQEDEQSTTWYEADVPELDADEFCERLRTLHKQQTAREPLLLVGNVGVGKTTYVHRTLQRLRESETGAFIAIVDLMDLGQTGENTAGASSDMQSRIAKKILEKLPHNVETVVLAKSLKEGERQQIEPR